jgi:hypothetical protein
MGLSQGQPCERQIDAAESWKIHGTKRFLGRFANAGAEFFADGGAVLGTWMQAAMRLYERWSLHGRRSAATSSAVPSAIEMRGV